MWQKLTNFLSNGGYATWVQTAAALVTVLVAYWTLRDTDIIQGKQTTLELARKYYSAEPTAALALLRLENAQLDVVNKARASLPAYDPDADAAKEILLKAARPMVKARIDGDKALQTDYETMRDVYYEVAHPFPEPPAPPPAAFSSLPLCGTQQVDPSSLGTA